MQSETTFSERVRAWADRFMSRLRKHWWWLFAIGPTLAFVWALIVARILTSVNTYIDAHMSVSFLKSLLSIVLKVRSVSPILVILAGVVIPFVIMFILAFWETRPSRSDLTVARGVPHLDLVYELPMTSDVGQYQSLRDDQIAVVNTTDFVAYDVQIEQKESSRYVATFAAIARISRDMPAKAGVDVRLKPSGSYLHSVEAICRGDYEDAPFSPDSFEVHVPLTVRFYDSRKDRQYETGHEIIYDSFWKKAHVRLVYGTRLVTEA
jgi:hypothetical protein